MERIISPDNKSQERYFFLYILNTADSFKVRGKKKNLANVKNQPSEQRKEEKSWKLIIHRQQNLKNKKKEKQTFPPR